MEDMKTKMLNGFLARTNISRIKGMKEAGEEVASGLVDTTRNKSSAEYYYSNFHSHIMKGKYGTILTHDLLHHAREAIAHNVLGYGFD